MKIVIVLALVAAASAKPTFLTPVAYAAPLAISTQYHAQDALGQYNYGYVNGLSSKAEVKSADGVTRGGYSYVDAEGKLQSVQYTSDAVNGFRVAATNLPVAPLPPKVEALPEPGPVEDTPEVAAAKTAHLAAVESAKVKTVDAAPVTTVVTAPVGPVVPSFHAYTYDIAAPLTYTYPVVTAYAAPTVLINAVPATSPVVDTPEVAQAKAEHLAAVEEVKARS